MQEMASKLGYSSADELIAAYEEQQIQDEAKQNNVDPEIYRKMNSMEKELNSMKQAKEEASRNQRITAFSNTLDTVTNKAGLGEDSRRKILEQMEADGYTMEDIVRLKNPERIIKSYLSEDLAEKKYQEKLALEKEAKKLKESKLDSAAEKATDWEDDLAKELAAYAKENNLYNY